MVDSSVFRKPFGLFLLYAGLSILFEKKKTVSRRDFRHGVFDSIQTRSAVSSAI